MKKPSGSPFKSSILMQNQVFMVDSEIERIRKGTRERAKALLMELSENVPEIRKFPQFAELYRIINDYSM